MTRTLMTVAVAGLMSAAAVLADEPKPAPPAEKPAANDTPAAKLDKAKIFAKLDADGDGKLTKDEFKAFTEKMTERLKDKGRGGRLPEGALGEKMFERMDADKDGKVSKEEFEKFDARTALRGKKAEDK